MFLFTNKIVKVQSCNPSRRSADNVSHTLFF